MRERVFCNHFRSMSDHETCCAGVEYATLKGIPLGERPCFAKRGCAANPGCDLVQLPTAEELAAQDAEDARRFRMLGEARGAIVSHVGGAWKKGMPGTSGELSCPCCDGGTLRYSRAGYNGHIHAACSTAGCVRWME